MGGCSSIFQKNDIFRLQPTLFVQISSVLDSLEFKWAQHSSQIVERWTEREIRIYRYVYIYIYQETSKTQQNVYIYMNTKYLNIENYQHLPKHIHPCELTYSLNITQFKNKYHFLDSRPLLLGSVLIRHIVWRNRKPVFIHRNLFLFTAWFMTCDPLSLYI